MSRNLAATVGGAAGAVALVGIVILLIWFCRFHKSGVSRNSETGSSDPSQGNNNVLVYITNTCKFPEGGVLVIQRTINSLVLASIHAVERHGGIELTVRDARRFEIEELSQATKNFSDKNLIGEGKFGEVYRGLLHDGMLVAIKKRHGFPSQELVDEVQFLSSIRDRNLVTLLGYCQENNLQFLIYEYVPNGSVSSHLYGAGQQSREKLEFKHRLSIALGAAKGLAHLHSLSPRLVHKDFKTANVLVDENFIPKVADAGLHNFLGRVEIAGPSSQVAADEIFLAPEVREFKRYSEKSDVYSFGVFLLELLSGREATESPSSDSNQNLVEWVQSKREHGIIANIVDERMGSNYTAEGMEEFMSLIVPCIDTSSERRPAMSYVMMEMDRILEKERNLTTVMGEGTPPIVTLGSQLFKATK